MADVSDLCVANSLPYLSPREQQTVEAVESNTRRWWLRCGGGRVLYGGQRCRDSVTKKPALSVAAIGRVRATELERCPGSRITDGGVTFRDRQVSGSLQRNSCLIRRPGGDSKTTDKSIIRWQVIYQ